MALGVGQRTHDGYLRAVRQVADFCETSPEQIREIEDLVNADVLANPPTRHEETSMDDAKTRGAIAFFGDKYGDRVPV